MRTSPPRFAPLVVLVGGLTVLAGCGLDADDSRLPEDEASGPAAAAALLPELGSAEGWTVVLGDPNPLLCDVPQPVRCGGWQVELHLAANQLQAGAIVSWADAQAEETTTDGSFDDTECGRTTRTATDGELAITRVTEEVVEFVVRGASVDGFHVDQPYIAHRCD